MHWYTKMKFITLRKWTVIHRHCVKTSAQVFLRALVIVILYRVNNIWIISLANLLRCGRYKNVKLRHICTVMKCWNKRKPFFQLRLIRWQLEYHHIIDNCKILCNLFFYNFRNKNFMWKQWHALYELWILQYFSRADITQLLMCLSWGNVSEQSIRSDIFMIYLCRQ